MSRVIAPAVAGCMLVLGAGVPASAVQETQEQLERTRQELESAESQAASLADQVLAAQAALAQADASLAGATERSRELDAAAAAADSAWQAAQERTADSTRRLVAADQRLRGVVADWRGERALLRDRAVALFKRGPGARLDAVLDGIVNARGPHDLVVRARMTDAVLAADERRVLHEEQLADAAADVRADVEEIRAGRVADEREAQRLREEARTLAEQQRQALVEVEAQRAERQAILDRFVNDRALAEELTRQLEQAALDLQRRLLTEAAAAWESLPADGPMPGWAGALPEHGRNWAPAIDAAARRVGVDPRLFAALVWAESYFRPGAVSRAGALGLAQLMPGTAARLGVDPTDPMQNLDGGARYLSQQLVTFGATDLALAAYNAGPGAVASHGGVPPYAETQVYVIRVLTLYGQIVGV